MSKSITEFLLDRIEDDESTVWFADDATDRWGRSEKNVISLRLEGQRLIDWWFIRQAFRDLFESHKEDALWIMFKSDIRFARIRSFWHSVKWAWSPRYNPPDTVLGAGGKPSAIVWWDEHADYMINNDPKRLLAECKAKRQIIEWWTAGGVVFAPSILRMMAAVYADHPDYNEEWRIS